MEQIKVNIKLTLNDKIYPIIIDQSYTIEKVKEECKKLTEIPIHLQNLVFEGNILKNKRQVRDYDIENGKTIILVKKLTEPPKVDNNQEKLSNSNNIDSSNNQNDNIFNTYKRNNNKNYNNNNNNQIENCPDLSKVGQILDSIDQNEFRNIIQNINGLQVLGIGRFENNNPKIRDLLNDPEIMQVINYFIQNPNLTLLAMKDLLKKELCENNSQMKIFEDNLEMMRQMFELLSNFYSRTNNMQTGDSNINPYNFGMDYIKLSDFLTGIQGLSGNQGEGDLIGAGYDKAQNEININNIDYKIKYEQLLNKLNNMGFKNEETNIKVLKECNENIDLAVEKLLKISN